jgi:predicted dinucleotide-binding enzyme
MKHAIIGSGEIGTALARAFALEAKQLVMELINSIGFVAIDLGSLKRVAPCMRSALRYPGPIFTSSGGFVESA